MRLGLLLLRDDALHLALQAAQRVAVRRLDGLDALSLALQRRRLLADGENANLTYREFELINYLVDRQGETVSRRELIDAVWADEPAAAPNDRTIDVHVRRLRSKITGYEDIIRTIRGGGYRFDRHPDVLVDNYQI